MVARFLSLGALGAAVLVAASTAHADGELHGSQEASSEWLPIFIGGSAGVIVGGLGGAALDPNQPPTWGGVVGGVLGGFTGGAAGSWLIRSGREQDTRLAGGFTGLGCGAGIAGAIFANTDQWGARIAAIVLLPTMGFLAGRSLAWHGMGEKEPRVASISIKEISPSVAPIVPMGGSGGSGLAIGVRGIFF